MEKLFITLDYYMLLITRSSNFTMD